MSKATVRFPDMGAIAVVDSDTLRWRATTEQVATMCQDLCEASGLHEPSTPDVPIAWADLVAAEFKGEVIEHVPDPEPRLPTKPGVVE